MVFTAPAWVPSLPAFPDSVSVPEFMLDEKYGRRPASESRDPYTCGLTGKTYTVSQVKERVDNLAKGLAQELGWEVNKGSEFDKVAGVFTVNTVDVMTVNWAIHRLNGISSPANAQFSAMELTYQLQNSGATCLFTCLPQLRIALEAAKKAKIPTSRIFLLATPETINGNAKAPSGMKTVDDLISTGATLPGLPPLQWTKGQGARQVAFLCYSSGTSGLPKGVLISHQNIIANVLQKDSYDSVWRKKHNNSAPETCLALLPQNHIYSLVVICHSSTYDGSQVIVLPNFELKSYLNTIVRFKIEELFLVPPIVVVMTKNPDVVKKYDLSSVKWAFIGAAPLGKETLNDLHQMFPHWINRQAYGLTEASPIVTMESRDGIWAGSIGTLVAGMEARLVDSNEKDITELNTPGELWVKGPNVTLGYLKNDVATKETYVMGENGDRWLRTGDEVEVRKHPETGHEYIWIVDRIKELIKVKGNQVPPAELEAHLLSHPMVNDVAVIAIPDPYSGEAPKAYIVKASSKSSDDDDKIKADIMAHVQKHKARYKWIKEVEFIDIIPKSASGKILRRELRDREKQKRKNNEEAKVKL